MAYGTGAFQNNPKVANQGANDATDFQRMLQMAMLASMMNEKAAIGYGLGALIGGGIKHRQDAADQAKIQAMNSKKYQFGTPNGTDVLMQKWNPLARQKPLTMQEVASAGAALNQSPNGANAMSFTVPPQVALSDGKSVSVGSMGQPTFDAGNVSYPADQPAMNANAQPAFSLLDPNKHPYGY